MARDPTYILSPNFTFLDDPSRSSWLGNIILDPLDPRTVLSAPDPPPLPPDAVATALEHDNQYHRTHARSVSSSVWASFLSVASADVGGARATATTATYAMARLETRYLRDPPSDEEVARRVRDSPRVREALRAGVLGRRPVYMVSGVKVARGLCVHDDVVVERSGRVGGGAAVTPDVAVSVGAQVDGSVRRQCGSAFTSLGDVVFAYQVHVIVPRGWRQLKLTTKLHRPKGAFLGSGSGPETEEVDVDVETRLAGRADLEEDLAEDIEEGEVGVLEGDEVEGCRPCCIYSRSESRSAA